MSAMAPFDRAVSELLWERDHLGIRPGFIDLVDGEWRYLPASARLAFRRAVNEQPPYVHGAGVGGGR